MDGNEPDLVEVEVAGVRRHLPADDLVVLLVDRASRLVVPIVIGPSEATAIAVALEGVVPARPLTHDLLHSILQATGHSVDHVEVTELVEGVFHAAVVLGTGARVDSRASDAIALAIRTSSRVLCSAEVVALAGVELGGDHDEDEVERFREFLDQVEPEDFGGPQGGLRDADA